MTTFGKTLAVLGFLAAGVAAIAPELRAGEAANTVREGQAVVTPLGPDASAVTYWRITSAGWKVVTRVDTVINRDGAAEQHAVVRFSAALLPRQSQVISVPVAIGEQQPVLRIERVGDHIEVTRIRGAV